VISGHVVIQKNGSDVAVLMSMAEFQMHCRTHSTKELVQRCHEESIGRFAALYKTLAE